MPGGTSVLWSERLRVRGAMTTRCLSVIAPTWVGVKSCDEDVAVVIVSSGEEE